MKILIETIKLDVNLIKLYKQFNKQLFDNELPNIPVGYNKLKNVYGRALAMGNKSEITSIDGIQISSFYDLEGDALKGILVHEMIHVWQYLNSSMIMLKKDNGHYIDFISKLKELQKKVSFKIPKTENADYAISGDIPSQIFDVIVRKKNNEIVSFILFKKDFLIKNKNQVIDFFKHFPDNYYMIQSDDRELLGFPVKRSLPKGKFNLYFPSDSLRKNLDKEKIIYIIKEK